MPNSLNPSLVLGHSIYAIDKFSWQKFLSISMEFIFCKITCQDKYFYKFTDICLVIKSLCKLERFLLSSILCVVVLAISDYVY